MGRIQLKRQPFITLQEAQSILSCGRSTLFRLIQTGCLDRRHVRTGRMGHPLSYVSLKSIRQYQKELQNSRQSLFSLRVRVGAIESKMAGLEVLIQSLAEVANRTATSKSSKRAIGRMLRRAHPEIFK